jgi:CCR4-NOT complex subunit CAF16
MTQIDMMDTNAPSAENGGYTYRGERHIETVKEDARTVAVKDLSYSYDARKHILGRPPPGMDGIVSEREKVLSDVTFEIEKGARMLVVGGNGAGKSTLLSIIGGRKMVPRQSVLIFGNRPAFHDTTLSQDVAYLGEWWTTDFYLNCRVKELLSDEQLASAHVATLAEALAVNLDWIVNRVSDGQRRRAQLLIALATPKDLYVLDEVTTDLDVIARDRLLELMHKESQRGATVLYATHIFDNLDGWATHIMRLHQGTFLNFQISHSIVLSFTFNANQFVIHPIVNVVHKTR